MASSGLPHSDPSDFSTATQGGTSDDPETFAKQFLDSGEIKRERVLELVRKLPGLRSRRQGDNPTSRSFVTGAYVFSGMTGLCNSFKTFPLCSRVLASFVQGVDPLHTFSSVAVFEDIAAPVHRDAHNDYDSINLIYALSDLRKAGSLLNTSVGRMMLFRGMNWFVARFFLFVIVSFASTLQKSDIGLKIGKDAELSLWPTRCGLLRSCKLRISGRYKTLASGFLTTVPALRPVFGLRLPSKFLRGEGASP